MTSWLVVGIVSNLLLGLSSAAPVEEKRAAAVPAAKHSFTLARQHVVRPGATVGSKFRHLRALNRAADPQPAGVDVAMPANMQVEYLLNVTVDGHNYSMIIDTGSSDTWFVKNGFQCLNAYQQKVPVAQCKFGPEFQGDFPGGRIAEQSFDIRYGSTNYGPHLNGEYGYADLTLTGVTIPKQQIALATSGYWTGDEISTGILGLGMPGLTEAIVSGGQQSGAVMNAISYSPVVTTMSTNAKLPSIFSLGLSRDPEKSFLALGGVPSDVKVGEWASTPLLQWQGVRGGSSYLWYTMQTDQMVWNSSTISQHTIRSPAVIVDSGTTLNLLPADIARAINNAYEPPAVYDRTQGSYFVECNATPPSFGIQIGGKMFWTDPSSMILPQLRTPDGRCATGIMEGYQDPYILGDVFMQGLVTVFEIGDVKQMRFAKRL